MENVYIANQEELNLFWNEYKNGYFFDLTSKRVAIYFLFNVDIDEDIIAENSILYFYDVKAKDIKAKGFLANNVYANDIYVSQGIDAKTISYGHLVKAGGKDGLDAIYCEEVKGRYEDSKLELAIGGVGYHEFSHELTKEEQERIDNLLLRRKDLRRTILDKNAEISELTNKLQNLYL